MVAVTAPLATAKRYPVSAGLQGLPPGPVGPIPLDGGGQRLIEVVRGTPPEGFHLVGGDRVAAVVAKAVLDVVDHRLVGAEQSQDLLGEETVGDLVAGPDV